jgi:hypothetical protein
MGVVLPLYYWPPVAWLEEAGRLREFAVGYPARLPRSSYYYRCYLPARGWLSIPLRRDSRKSPWQATWPPDSRWKLYHFKVIQTLYGKAPFFLEWKPLLEEIYRTDTYQTLAQVAWRIIQEIALGYGWKVSLMEAGVPLALEAGLAGQVSSLDRLLRVGVGTGGL